MTLATKVAVLNEGRIQQVGTPEELYDRPANEFVAQFIGSPSMNMFECEIRNEGGELVLDFGHFEKYIDGDTSTLLQDYELESITVGIRPEDLRIGESLSNQAEVKIVEPVESDMLVYLDVNGREVIVQTERPKDAGETRNQYSQGSSIGFELPIQDLHFFHEGKALDRKSKSKPSHTEVP
jgi:multiple sugar transport system ATP-binding protein